MGLYRYSGRDVRGKRVEGRLEAGSVDAVLTLLAAQRIMPITIGAAAGAPGKRLHDFYQRAVATEELLMFCRQMGSMIKAGIPVVQAIRILSVSSRSEKLAENLAGCADSLESGKELSSALAQFPQTFTPLFVNMINVGENTGRLDEAFFELGRHLESERETGKRMKQATRYPGIVLIVITGAILLMNYMVIPSFARLFSRFKAELPLPTRMLIGTSDFLVHYGVLLACLLAIAFFLWRQYVRTEAGTYRRDRWRLGLPLVGDIYRRMVLSRFARCMAMMLRSGIPVIQTLNVTSRALDNEFVGQAVREMAVAIERGDNISRAATATGLFSPLVLQMLMVGEESGTLDQMLVEVADFYDGEIDYDLKQLADRIEPILIVVIGLVVLVLALGIFLPLWNLNSVFNH
ncbi:MAG: biosis protein MshG [Moraxellaceae bacterium]|jgi:MSHA biogenesis protein MshG|nr:biosis protein MshG [Moraxellaceae bacterium]